MMHYDIIVVGGGLSGVAAAVSGARQGLKVLLVEKSGCLGGAISNNLVYPFTNCWTYMPDTNEKRYVNGGLFAEMRRREEEYRIALGEPKDNPEYLFKPEYYKFILDDMVTEAGVEVLFHSMLCEVSADKRKIRGIVVITPSGILELSADYFIDTTGNGELFAKAGCDYQLGREEDNLCQPMTTCFRMSGVDTDVFKKDHNRLGELYNEYQKQGKIKNPRENILIFYGIGKGIIHFNTTRVVKCDPTDAFAVSRAEIEARRQVYEMVHFLKKNSKAFENSTVISIATEIGIRESRKLRGVHILTEQELKDMTDFDDVIALGNYDIDIHNPSGTGTSHYYFGRGEYYKIPYRSLLPKEYDNLLVAGRCISTTHRANASVRVMPICACTGQAAGTAAAVAKSNGAKVGDVDINEVQRILKEDGAILTI